LQTTAARIDRILSWALEGDEFGKLVGELCEDLRASGVPLCRVSVNMRTLDPTIRAISYVWQPGTCVEPATAPHGYGDEGEAMYRRSPIARMIAAGRVEQRWRLDEAECWDDLPLLDELREQGATDYSLHLVAFGGATAASMPGLAVGISTDRPRGFAQSEIDDVKALLPALAAAAYRFSLTRIASEVLGVYLGSRSARRVLAGEVRRGMGRTITAAILLADLRSFTPLTDDAEPARVVEWLDEHLEAAGAPIEECGGEILKFLGDGLLAVFPVEEHGGDEGTACARALRAAEQALARTSLLNASRRVLDEPTLELDVALHFGEVIYGNVGTQRRLDFTVIGRAVNEASRIEELCDVLNRRLLMSGGFADRCGRPSQKLGRFQLRGLSHNIDVVSLMPPGERRATFPTQPQ
jgi:adenylate cyclase